MKRKEFLLIVLLVCLGVGIFFYKVLLNRQIPFPGDLLSTTTPFKTESYLGYGPGGYPNKAQGRDVIDQSIPWRQFSISQIKKGNLPFWNPYNFSGNNHIGDFQTGVFYPFNILFLFMPFPIVWTLFILSEPILAWIFMYLFLRSLSLQKSASYIGGLAFAFSSYMIVWMEYGNIGHTFLWLPLTLFSITKWFETKQKRYSILLFVALICCFLAGYIQGAFYVFVLSFLYSVGKMIFEKKSFFSWIYINVFFFLALCVSMFQLLPTLSAFTHGTRGNYTISQIQNLLQPWYYIVTIFSSDFFGNPATRNYFLPITYFERVMYPGIAILFFTSIAVEKVKLWQVKFFACLAGLVLFFNFNIPGIAQLYTIPIPILSTTVPTRSLSLFIFCMCILGAYGINWWLTHKEKKAFSVIVFAAIYCLLVLIVFLLPRFSTLDSKYISVIKHNVFFSLILAFGTIIIFYIKNYWKKGALIFLICIVGFDALYLFTKFTPFAPAALFYPNTQVLTYLQTHSGIDRSWGYGSASIPANYATYYGIYNADGFDSLYIKEYGELLNTSMDGKLHLPLSRGDANIAPGYGAGDLRSNIYREKILNLIGVKHIINLNEAGNTANADNETFPPEKYKLIWFWGPWQIYENLHVLPRFFLSTEYRIIPSSQKMLHTIYAADVGHIVLLSSKPNLTIASKATGFAKLLSYAPQTIRIEVQTTGNQLLFLSDTYDPSWKATVDGKATPMYKADYAFRAIAVPKGRHTVIFFYDPSAFTIGLIISLIAVFCCGAWLLVKVKL